MTIADGFVEHGLDLTGIDATAGAAAVVTNAVRVIDLYLDRRNVWAAGVVLVDHDGDRVALDMARRVGLPRRGLSGVGCTGAIQAGLLAVRLPRSGATRRPIQPRWPLG